MTTPPEGEEYVDLVAAAIAKMVGRENLPEQVQLAWKAFFTKAAAQARQRVKPRRKADALLSRVPLVAINRRFPNNPYCVWRAMSADTAHYMRERYLLPDDATEEQKAQNARLIDAAQNVELERFKEWAMDARAWKDRVVLGWWPQDVPFTLKNWPYARQLLQA
jgi:hypothetical protein